MKAWIFHPVEISTPYKTCQNTPEIPPKRASTRNHLRYHLNGLLRDGHTNTLLLISIHWQVHCTLYMYLLLIPHYDINTSIHEHSLTCAQCESKLSPAV